MGEELMSNLDGEQGIFVHVDTKGTVWYIDGAQGPPVQGDALRGHAPYSVSCSLAAGTEPCIIVDAAGSVWRGRTRGGVPFTKIK
jgi:hypothetical protein